MLVSLVSMLFADWKIGLIVAVIAICVMAFSKYVSLGSIFGACLFVVLGLMMRAGDIPFTIFSLILSLLTIFMHRSNIVRLIKGEENKTYFGKKRGDK